MNKIEKITSSWKYDVVKYNNSNWTSIYANDSIEFKKDGIVINFEVETSGIINIKAGKWKLLNNENDIIISYQINKGETKWNIAELNENTMLLKRIEDKTIVEMRLVRTE